MPSFGALPSPPDTRDYPVAMRMPNRAASGPLRPSKRVLTNMPRVYDQGTEPTCVAATAAGYTERMERDACNSSVAMNIAAHYARCKALDGIPNAPGTYPRVSCDILVKEGIPNIVGRGQGHFRFKAYYRVEPTYAAIADTIASTGWPVRVALNWPAAWTGGEGSVMEDAYMYGGEMSWTGYSHEMWAYGYDDDMPAASVERALAFRNSWGLTFGNKGNVWVPAEQLDGTPGPRRSLVTMFEAWVMEPEGWSRT